MINREIMNELKKKKPLPTIYKLIKKIREKSGYKLTKEETAYVLAGNLEIDIAKYLSKEELEGLRNTSTEIRVIEMKSKLTPQPFQLKIKGFTTNIPFLPNKIIQNCQKMSETYQSFYLLENSIRFFILYLIVGLFVASMFFIFSNH